MDKKCNSTAELCEELKEREAVQEISVEPYQKFEVILDGKAEETEIKEGPARVFIVWD